MEYYKDPKQRGIETGSRINQGLPISVSVENRCPGRPDQDRVKGFLFFCLLPIRNMDVWSRVAVWILCGFLLQQGQGERPPGTHLDDATIAGKDPSCLFHSSVYFLSFILWKRTAIPSNRWW